MNEDEKKINKALDKAIFDYNNAYTDFNDGGTKLYFERTVSSYTISLVESFINSIANTPKEFETTLNEVEKINKDFTRVCDYAAMELENAKKAAGLSGAGIAAGGAIASVAPTAAMWIATTFGTASTGTAISTLSGAAAQNAALAWLGGGALSAGGGGIAAGNALLALAGPVGWGIAGAFILGSVVILHVNKTKLLNQKSEEIKQINSNTAKIKLACDQLNGIMTETVSVHSGIKDLYRDILPLYGKDYSEMSEDNKKQLATLVNNTFSLAKLMDKFIES